MGVVLDSHSPQDYSQTALETLAGDYISKWIDKSSLFVVFKNGTFGCMGEVMQHFFLFLLFKTEMYLIQIFLCFSMHVTMEQFLLLLVSLFC